MAEFGRGNKGFHRILVAQISLHHVDTLTESAGKFVERAAPRARQGDDGPLSVKRASNRAADAAGCARDECLTAREIEHGFVLNLEERL